MITMSVVTLQAINRQKEKLATVEEPVMSGA